MALSPVIASSLLRLGSRAVLLSSAPTSSASLVEHHLVQCRRQSTRADWKHAVSAAEKLVGYPTSFLTLRSLLSDEMSNVASHLRKLVGTSHPLMDTAKQMVCDGPQTLQTRGLLVLLVSKAAGGGEGGPPQVVHDTPAGVMHSQRSLAEITEMIHTAQLIHKGVVNLHHNGNALDEYATANPDFEFGNKIAILCGDYMLANACKALAALQNSEVVELMSSAISDFTEAEFVGERDEFGRPVPTETFDVDCWRGKSFLSVGSLIAKSSKSALLLAGHRDPAGLELMYAFGRQMAWAWQAQQELQPFVGALDTSGAAIGSQVASGPAIGSQATVGAASGPAIGPHEHKIDVTSLPVVLHIQHYKQGRERDMATFFKAIRDGRTNGDADEYLVQEVVAGGVGVASGLQVVQEHCHEALRLLQGLPESEARTALQNLVKALEGTN